MNIRNPSKRLWGSLGLLAFVLILGTRTARAGISDIPIIGHVWSFFGDILGSVAGGIGEAVARGIAWLLGIIIDIIGSLFYFVANAAVRFAIEMNLLLPAPNNFLIREGFATTLAVANIALVLGLIVIAIATMTRAEWITETRKALPKFLTAALLMNFGLFITLNLIIQPVDFFTKRIYEASNFDENSFRGPFDVNLHLEPLLQAQLAISNAEPGDDEKIADYFDFVDTEIRQGVYQELIEAEEHIKESQTIRLFSTYIELSVITEQQRTAVVDAVTRLVVYDYITYHDDSAPLFFTFNLQDWDDLRQEVNDALDAGGAPYDINDIYEGSYTRNTLSDNLLSFFKESFQNEFGCDIEEMEGSACDDLVSVAVLSSRDPSSLEAIAIVFAEVLFEGLFVFLGSFALLGLAAMLFIRYVALTILIILFPFVWFGWIFPKIATAGGGKNIWNAWWGQFIRWVLFAPLVMFFFFLAIKGSLLLTELTPPIANYYGGKSTISVLAASVGNLMAVLGLLIGGIYAANKMGIAGAGLFYNSIIKMRNWVGKQFKRAGKFAVSPIAKGWEHAKSAARAKRLDLLTRKDRTKEGQERLGQAARTGTALQKARARRRMRRAKLAEDAIDAHAKRRTQYRDLSGELKDIPGGFRQQAILAGILDDIKKKEAAGGKASEADVLGLANAMEPLHEKGFQWESDFIEASAKLQDYDGYRKAGKQKMENDQIAMGMGPQYMQQYWKYAQLYKKTVDSASDEEVTDGTLETKLERLRKRASRELTRTLNAETGIVDSNKIKFEGKVFGDIPRDAAGNLQPQRVPYGIGRLRAEGDPESDIVKEKTRLLVESAHGSFRDAPEGFLAEHTEQINRAMGSAPTSGRAHIAASVGHMTDTLNQMLADALSGVDLDQVRKMGPTEKLNRIADASPGDLSKLTAAASKLSEAADASHIARTVGKVVAKSNKDNLIEWTRNLENSGRRSIFGSYWMGGGGSPPS